MTKTCRILGWPKTRKPTLHYWKHGKYKPLTTRWIPEPSKESAYIIGILHGDGYIHIHGYHYDIELEIRDIEVAEEFSKSLSKILCRRYRAPKWSEAHNKWRTYYSSKAFHIMV